MIVLTVGKSYVDIDGYASCLAYRELLKMQGVESKFVTHAAFNYSITKSLLNSPYRVDKYIISTDDQFIILDLSNKDFFPEFVNQEKIIQLIDHHPGFEKYWDDKLGKNLIIDQIGSVATIIVEKYEQSNLIEKMDKNIAKLLMAAILDNTLNFTAKITTDRDRNAYSKLQVITGELDFANVYFNECQNTIESKLEESIINDLKHQKTNEYLPDTIGQLTIWDIDRLKDKKDIGIKNNIFITTIANTPHYEDNCSIFTENEKQKIYLEYHDELPCDLEIACELEEEYVQTMIETRLYRPKNTMLCGENFIVKEDEIFINLKDKLYRYYQLCPHYGYIVNIPKEILSNGIKQRIEDRCSEDNMLFRKMFLYSELFSLDKKSTDGQKKVLKK